MNKVIVARFLTLLAAGLILLAGPGWAQDRVYRCGNEYTNQPQGRTNCKPVEGGNITIIQGTTPRAAPAPTPGKAATTPAASAEPSAAQRRRQEEARAILQQELVRAETRQAELEAEYKGGQPDKLGPETRNYQKYLDRVAELEAAMARNEADIEGIKRELKRYE